MLPELQRHTLVIGGVANFYSDRAAPAVKEVFEAFYSAPTGRQAIEESKARDK